MNDLPVHIPPGTRFSHAVQLASSRSGGSDGGHLPRPRPVEVAQLPEPPRAVRPAPTTLALVTPPPPPPAHRGFHFIQQAVAEPIPFRHAPAASGGWAIQVGAFTSASQAHAALGSAQEKARIELAIAHPMVASVHQGHGVLWRARLTGLSRETAVDACGKLSRARFGCIVLSPEGQS
jgi:hypothetical protein